MTDFPRKNYYDCVMMYNNRSRKKGGNIEIRKAFFNILNDNLDDKHEMYTYYYISKLFLNNDMYNDAKKYIGKALEIDGDNPILKRHEAGIYYKQRKYNINIQNETDMKYCHGYQEILKLYNYVYKLYMTKGIDWIWISPPKGGKTFKKRVEIHLSIVLREYGHVLYLNGEYSKSQEMFEKYVN